MKNLSSFSKKFNINKTSIYILSLQLDKNGYSYIIVDPILKRYIAIKHVNFEQNIASKSFGDKIKEIFLNENILNKNYKTFNFCFLSQKNTLVPTSLFDNKNLKSYFEFNHIPDNSEELRFNFLKNTEAYNIFAVPTEITTFLINRIPKIKFYNQASIFIESTIDKAKIDKLKTPFVRININIDFFDIAIIISEKLILYNTFSYKNENDIIYFILNIFEKLNLPVDGSYISISGDIEARSDFFIKINNFVKNIKFSNLKKETEYIFNNIPEHFLYNISNLHLCE